jgi:hypothetical protein
MAHATHHEAILAVLRPCDPADGVPVVVGLADLGIGLGPELHAVLADEDRDGATLALVRRDRLLERLDRRHDDRLESLLVNGHRHLPEEIVGQQGAPQSC